MKPTRKIPWKQWASEEAARRGMTVRGLLMHLERHPKEMPRRRKVNSRVIYVLV